ncbi:MAG: MFS transporter [Chloroflexi bacterium]|nr:MFS transporter [Chloroflexota bacterium]
MILKFRRILDTYPRQFWLLVVVMMLAWTFHSMIWPFLILYASQKLNQPLTTVAGLLTLNAVMGILTTFIGGAIADRFGRKWVMAFSLILCALSWFFFQLAGTLPLFALLMALTGATTPLYRLAADAMVADLVPAEDRITAYSVMRLGNNLGVALGPAIGGFMAAISYNISFAVVGIGIFVCGLLVVVFSIETVPLLQPNVGVPQPPISGYLTALKDRNFLNFLGSFSFNRICSSILWLLLAVYTKQNFGISEKLFGFIPMTNAIMVVLFQIFVTNWVKRRPPVPSMALGAFFYAAAVFAVAFGRGFWVFWFCMVVATIGEMILLPTSTTYVSRLAPDHMRARYMGLYTLTWGIGTGVGPLLGGILSDQINPPAIWIGGGIIGLIGAILFCFSSRTSERLSWRKFEV